MIRAAALLVAVGCTSLPRLDSVYPLGAAPGVIVELQGEGFCGRHDDCVDATGQVQLGDNPPYYEASLMMWDATAVEIIVPEMPAGKTRIVIDVDDEASNALPFEVEAGN